MKKIFLPILLGAAMLTVTLPAWAARSHGPFRNLTFRNIGPAVAGGRVTSVVGVPGNRNLYFVGTAGGGVWKTTNGGDSWQNVFDHESTMSIGAVALDSGHPDWVWVGTGEANPRNDMINGAGVYFSPDGGKTWENMGLNQAGQIGAIAVNPDDPSNVFVCALGDVWKRGPVRGVFMTRDGGRTWKKVLYLNSHTGCSDIAFQPGNPKVLIAGMWPLQRYPWLLVSGGRSGGLYRSLDGGRTWKKLMHGLPKGPIGRSAVAFAPSQPDTVYAVIQAKGGVLWASHDGGSHWQLVSDNHNDDVRPFYFTNLAVMPNNPERLFMLSMKLMESTDGGRTSFYADPGVHVDHHAIWIDPHDPDRIIQGNDGGVYLSTNGGKHWRFLGNLPIEQFYQVAVADRIMPFLVCGGLQDNNAWCGASSDYRRGGVVGAQDWFQISGGDGQYVVPAPSDPNIIYATTDDGYLTRFNRVTRRARSINPYLRDELTGDILSGKVLAKQKYRFDWTSPIAVSPTDPNSIYIGGDVVFHSTNGGRHWAVISPDLTRDVKAKQGPTGGPVTKDLSGAETYDTIQSITLAPTNPHVIWVGTDDGWVWVSRNDGGHWTKVTPSGAPQWARVYHVTVSPFHAGTAFAAFDAHELGNNHPYVFRTDNYGRSWHRITRGLPDASVLVVRQDPNDPGLLMAGTMQGLYYSQNGGRLWKPLHANLTTAAVFDLQFVKPLHSLVLATHGRGIWILDNLRPVEELTPAVAREPFHLFHASNGYMLYASHTNGVGPAHFRGPNATTGVVISYYLNKALKPNSKEKMRHETPVKIVIADPAGQKIDTLWGTAKSGVNEAVWNLVYKGPTKLQLMPQSHGGFFGGNFGPRVVPGTYRVEVTTLGKTEDTTARVLPDPRYSVPLATYRANTQAGLEMRSNLSALNTVLNRTHAIEVGLDAVMARAHQDAAFRHAYPALIKEAGALNKMLGKFEAPLWNPKTQHTVSEDFLRHYTRLHMHAAAFYGMTAFGWGEKPRAQVQALIRHDHRRIGGVLATFNTTIRAAVLHWNRMAYAQGLATLPIGQPVTFHKVPALPEL
ncbi:MAG: WD40/YVTN/BNR-like repeat-containing protein [Gammaproteobacteria bacterium]